MDKNCVLGPNKGTLEKTKLEQIITWPNFTFWSIFFM